MRIPNWILEPLARLLIGWLDGGKLTPHRYGDIRSADGSLYMARGWLVQPHWWTLGWSARVHRTERSDSDRHLHDHPWLNISVILRGWYYEEVPFWGDEARLASMTPGREMVRSLRRSTGDVVSRLAEARHRLVIPDGGQCYSLFIMGPWRQVWGFYPPEGKVNWREYLGLPPKSEGERH